MKNLADTAFWIYALGVTGTIALGAHVLFARTGGTPLNLGSLTSTELVMLGMALTMIFGLFIVMPTVHKVQSQTVQLTNRAAELEFEAFTDPLTGLYNRRYFEKALAEYLAGFSKSGAHLCLLTLDLDHFKNVNDMYGHDAGDVVLKKLGATLKGLTRDHDVVARTGGEEFAIVAPFAHLDQVYPFAERICHMVSQMRIDVGKTVLCPTISIGCATTQDVATVKELVKLSDERLYKAKQGGRNRVCAGDL